ncbi:MAG TPA: ATP-dependent zinc metalloprotease FtsH [Candidatus Angelobacter sp.]|jgi:cell division protease FtsH|nr:ATP-dependent zinc metalloprotease FtsH [Candidatus Angelobacter sp.]
MARYRAWMRDRRRRGKRFLPQFLTAGNGRLMTMLVLSLAGLVLAFVLLLRFASPVSTGEQLTYTQFHQLSAAKRVQTAAFHDVDHRITGTYLNTDTGRAVSYWTAYPSSDAETPALITQLTDANVAVTIDAQTDKQIAHFVVTYVLPLVMLANLFALIFIGAQASGGAIGGLSEFSGIGGGRGGKPDENQRVTFADVAGAETAVQELAEIEEYLRDPERFAALGAKPPKGVLMFGPPGCGKTLMARAVAGQAGVPFFSISGAEFVESLVGVGAARVRDLFRQVRKVAPAIVFIDEIDAAGRRRGGVHGGQEEREQTLNQLLIEMDGFDPTEGLVVIGATNRPDILDPALLRPGRFDRQVTVEPPDLDGRVQILNLYARKRPMENDVDLLTVAKRTPGFTGADLANVINESALLAVREGHVTISRLNVDEAVQRVLTGPRRKGHLLSDEERRRAAYHEVGHVLVATMTGRLHEVPRVTIVAHGRNLGATVGRGWAERTLITRSELIAELVTVMAGTAAEEIVFGDASTGADADLERATQVATLMVGRYGMGKRLGKVHLLKIDGSEFLGGELVPTELVDGDLLGQLHQEVRELLDDADARAGAMLREHRVFLDTIVQRLLDQETLDGPELAPLLEPLRPVDGNGALPLSQSATVNTSVQAKP